MNDATGDRIIRLLVLYQGNVQGVGFRMTAVAKAKDLKVKGYVRNESDGSVRMDVEGDRREIRELMARIDSAMCGKIEHTEVREMPVRGIDGGFAIRY